MPELAEVKITADYINQYASKFNFTRIVKNPDHKGVAINPPFDSFKLFASSRGKEIVLVLRSNQTKVPIQTELNQNLRYTEEGFPVYPIRLTLGMTGHFALINKLAYTNPTEIHRFGHLAFVDPEANVSLVFLDMRRFGKWKPGYSFSPDKGYDPLFEHGQFKSSLWQKLNDGRQKGFNSRLICNTMMDQKYFAGIGNYLRAEILYQADINPFQPISNLAKNADTFSLITDLCYNITYKAYQIGGAELYTWKNPLRAMRVIEGSNLLQCYNNPAMSKIKDKQGRTFWYNPKWNN